MAVKVEFSNISEFNEAFGAMDSKEVARLIGNVGCFLQNLSPYDSITYKLGTFITLNNTRFVEGVDFQKMHEEAKQQGFKTRKD